MRRSIAIHTIRQKADTNDTSLHTYSACEGVTFFTLSIPPPPWCGHTREEARVAMWGNKFRARVVFGQRVARLSSHPSPELALVVEECARVQSDTAISDDMSCHSRLAHSTDHLFNTAWCDGGGLAHC